VLLPGRPVDRPRQLPLPLTSAFNRFLLLRQDDPAIAGSQKRLTAIYLTSWSNCRF
jgi:hypothetical protein